MLLHHRLYFLTTLLIAQSLHGLEPDGNLDGSSSSPMWNFSPLIDPLLKSASSFIYKSYQQQVYCNASSPIVFPRNGEELQQLIRGAIQEGKTVKVLGGRYSISDIICTEGTPISTQLISYTQVNSDKTATFGSGTDLSAALEALHEAGLTLAHVPTFGGITIGGAIGTGAHGSSLRHPTAISDQIVNVTLIDGKGEIRHITEEDGDDFRAIGVHLGLLGAIVNVTLRTTPLFKMTVENYPDSEEILLNGTALADARLHDLYQLWWFPNTQSVVVSKGVYTTDLKKKGNATTNLLPDITPLQIGLSRSFLELMQLTKIRALEYAMESFTAASLYKRVIGKPPIFSEDDENGNKRFVNPATGYGYRLLANKCTDKCTWENGASSVYPEESAMAFDVNELPNVITTIKRILKEVPAAFSMIGIYIRFSKGSTNLMAIESGRDTVHMDWATPMRIDPFNNAKSGIGAYQAILQAMVDNHDGRPHWGKNGQYFFTRSMLQSQSPNLATFQNKMREYDPNGIFLNKFGRRLLLQSDDLSVDPSVTHCALQDYCMCSDDSDCATFQTCKKVDGKYNVCQDLELLKPGSIDYSPPMKDYDMLNISSIFDAINKFVREEDWIVQ